MTKNTVWMEGDSGKLATLSSDIQWNIKQFSIVRCYDGTKPQSGLYSALGIKYYEEISWIFWECYTISTSFLWIRCFLNELDKCADII